MSKLDELIKELCPNGVEKIEIKRCVLAVNNIKWKYTSPEDIFEYIDLSSVDIETHRIINTIQINVENAPSRAQQVVQKNDILLGLTRPMLKRYCIVSKEYDGQICSTGFSILRANEHIILSNYLYHLISSSEFFDYVEKNQKGASYPAITDKLVKEYKVPVPPLEVQREMVRILDSFTLLTAELTAELTARKKQYEYYRDELLKPHKGIPIVTLKEIAVSIYRGTGIKRDQVTEDGVPCVRYGEIYTTYNTWFDECVSHTKEEYVSSPKYFEYGDILFAITGESVEDISKSIAYIGYEKCLAGGDIVVMKHNQNPRYLAHVLNTSMAREQKSKGKVKSKVVHSNVSSIEQIRIPLPTLEVQERYADVLDNFEKICNDLNIGLPAEIEARKKQYEYYRDVLLTFAETGSTILTDRQTDRQTVIKLIQYVFGYVPVRLDEIATIIRGGNFQKKDFVENGRPCIHYGQMYTHFGVYADETITFVNEEVFSKSKIARHGDIVMAVTSENVEDVCSCTAWLGDEEVAISGHTAIIRHNQNAKYMSYFFHSSAFFEQKKRLAHGTKVIEVTPSKLGGIEILLPTIEEQSRIVSILDRFDSLCNDITSGLPAEIEARKKQYEYYRDKLLEFK